MTSPRLIPLRNVQIPLRVFVDRAENLCFVSRFVRV